MNITATDAKSRFGQVLDTAQREPVTIEKNGRAFAVMLSKHDYDRLQAELQELRSDAETAFLLRGRNAERLSASMRDLDEGRVVEKSLEELEALANRSGDRTKGDAD